MAPCCKATLLIFLSFIAFNISENLVLNCNESNQCASTSFTCPENSQCTIICSADNACHGLNLDFQTGSKGNITCNYFNACAMAMITFATNSIGNITCTEDNACWNAIVQYDSGSIGHIACTYYQSCFEAEITFGGKSGAVLCNGGSSSCALSLTCDNICEIDCVKNSCDRIRTNGDGTINYEYFSYPPTINPTMNPTMNPSSTSPTIDPSFYPSTYPTETPTNRPTLIDHITSAPTMITGNPLLTTEDVINITGTDAIESNADKDSKTGNKHIIAILLSGLFLVIIGIVCVVVGLKLKSKKRMSNNDVMHITMGQIRSNTKQYVPPKTTLKTPMNETVDDDQDTIFISKTKGNEHVLSNNIIVEGIDEINNKQHDFDIIEAIDETTLGQSDDSSGDELFGIVETKQ